jgi:hypothetical protein
MTAWNCLGDTTYYELVYPASVYANAVVQVRGKYRMLPRFPYNPSCKPSVQ